MVTCYIGIGSNLGDRQYYINTAIKKIMMLIGTRVRKISRVIESLPQGGPPQGPYLNGVIEIDTDLNPYQLLQELQKIESSLGRVRSVVNAARTIDLDILTYADLCIDEDALCIPHPRILERQFVLEPLKEIAPGGVIKKIIDIFRKKKLKGAQGQKSTGAARKRVPAHKRTRASKRRAPVHRRTRAPARTKRQTRKSGRKR